ncbi:MAG: twin-arginine translocase TatA/TatE family subunit [Gemmatimonadetes bacterium]|nr:twin-arginine translocase TatA/TatE family subunit [Gemmatimonadota bacterium]
MFGLGPTELVMIIAAALLIFGPSRLPKVGRQIGEAVRSFRGIQDSTTQVKKKVQKDFEDMILGPPENN